MARVDGEVTVHMSINSQGKVENVETFQDKQTRQLSHNRLYSELVKDAEVVLRQWRFEPCSKLKDITVQVQFRIVTQKQGLPFVQTTADLPSSLTITAYVQPTELMQDRSPSQDH
jgi:Gram-negative bacterial TonB protein C-terminal